MPKRQMENDVSATAEIRANLEQKRDGIVNSLTGASNKHAQEQQALQKIHDEIMRKSDIDNPKVGSILAEQGARLESLQRSRVELINKALDAAARVENNGSEGPRQALQILNTAADLNGRVAEAFKQQQLAEIEKLNEVLVTDNVGQRNEQTQDLIQSQKQAQVTLKRDIEMAAATVERSEALAQNLLDRESRDHLRASVAEATKSDRMRALLTDEAVQRLANEALCPGKKLLQQIDEQAAVQRVKGELAELMAADNELSEISRENRTRAEDRKLFFIAGDRIRDEQGKKLTDGLTVWRDQQGKLLIWKALEVKAGPSSARELNRKIEKLTREQEMELRKYALDLAREELATRNGLTSEQARAETERLAKDFEADLRSRKVQIEDGQRRQTTERLDLAERIYIDGKAQQVSVDSERRLNDIVKKVATEEALRRDEEVQRLGIRSLDLEAIAKAFFEELLRRR